MHGHMGAGKRADPDRVGAGAEPDDDAAQAERAQAGEAQGGDQMTTTNAPRMPIAAFMADFEAVMAHYAIEGPERLHCLQAARRDYVNACRCYRAMAQSLRPEVRSRYGKANG